MRLLEHAAAIELGTAERAAHVAEELTLDERLRYGAAVDRDEGTERARGLRMQRARHDVFSRPRLALDEDGRVVVAMRSRTA